MVEEEPEGNDKFRKKDIESSHPIVNEVLSKISEMEKEEKKKMEKKTAQEKFLGNDKREIPGKGKSFLKKKLNTIVKTFSILLVLFFAGWFLVGKGFHIKSWLAERFSILTQKIMKEKDSVWIKRKIPGAGGKREISSSTGEVRKDVKGIPIYAGAEIVSTSSQDNVSTLNLATSDSMERVVPFYLREMESKGYGLVKADYWPGADVGQLFFSKEGKDCIVSLIENETGGVSVAISYTE